ncbi:MAG: hypothetical protein DMF32_04735 [Verrucomicrobia bacterium]|nr:MAG: hypothetical protein DMF32_04735 [Verrucomicrobiota bacterium]
MTTKSVGGYPSLLCILNFSNAAHLLGANMRSFIESVRRKAPVVYVGSVKEVRVLQRTKFDINAKAFVHIKAVMRTAGSIPQQASIECSSYDDKTPMLEGGLQYQLRPAFQLSFLRTLSKPGFRLDISCTSRQELLERVEALRDALSKMSPEQLQVNEIEDDRRIQMSLYEKLSVYLRAAK